MAVNFFIVSEVMLSHAIAATEKMVDTSSTCISYIMSTNVTELGQA